MPISFRDAEDIAALGAAAFLKLESAADGASQRGALLVLDARGEPLEFVFNRVETAPSILWRRADLHRHAQRRLVASLLDACQLAPRLLLYLADEVAPGLFSEELRLAVPAIRVGPAPAETVDRETGEIRAEPPHFAWQPGPPAEGSAERLLADRLVARGLLREPFERAATGLEESYAPSGGRP